MVGQMPPRSSMPISERVRRGETVHLRNWVLGDMKMDVVPEYDTIDGRIKYVAGFSFMHEGKPISKAWHRKLLDNLDFYITDGQWEEDRDYEVK